MTIQHHPSDETLVRFAARTLSVGTWLVVASHIERCSRCSRDVGLFEAVGGALVDGAPETALSEDCFARMLSKIERHETTVAIARQRAAREVSKRPGGFVLPRALDACDMGPWRWLGPGIRLSRVTVPHEPDANIILLRVGANRPLPEHGHTGKEFTQILSGTLIDGSIRMGAGDIMEADADLEHQPVAGPEGECISLAAVDGKLRIDGLIGRTMLSMIGL